VAPSSVQLIVDASKALNPLKQVKQAVGDLDKQFEKLKSAAKGAANNVVQFARETEKSTQKVRDQIGAVQSLVGAYAGFSTIKGLVTAGVELETATKRAELLVDRFDQLAGVQQVAAKSANTFKLSQTEVLNSLIDLGNRLGPQGASLTEIQDIYDGFNTILAINKVSSQEAASAQLQLNQALGAGKLQGEEYRAVNEATPQVIDAVAKVLGVARGEVKELASQGAVSAPVLIEALRSVKAEGADILQQSLDSTSGKLRDFQASQAELSQALGTQLLPAFTPILNSLTQAIKSFTDLPEPVKTTTAAVVALSAAVLVLNPLLTTAIALIKAIGVATLIAAGPWVALAAGITAATVALASYQTQAEKTAKAAATGDSEALHKARTELHATQQQIALLRQEKLTATGRELHDIKQDIVRLTQEEKKLREGIAAGAASEISQASTGGLTTMPSAPEEEEAGKKKVERKQKERDLAKEALELEQAAYALQDQQQLAFEEAINDLHKEQAIQQAILNGNEEEVRNAYLLKDLIEEHGEEKGNVLYQNNLNLQSLQDQVKEAQKLKEAQKEAAAQLKALYEDVGASIKNGVVDALEGAIQGTQSLAEAASNMLNDIASKLLDVAVNLALFGTISGFGTGGGLLGGLIPRANGGTVTGGSSYLVGEEGPELFTPGRTGSIAPNDSLGGANVTVNVDASGSSVQGDSSQANMLGQALGAAVQAELIKQKRPGGLLA